MRTTLDLPEELVTEGQKLLGYKSKTDVVIFALKELIRQTRIKELKELVGSVELDLDLGQSRRRPNVGSPARRTTKKIRKRRQ